LPSDRPGKTLKQAKTLKQGETVKTVRGDMRERARFTVNFGVLALCGAQAAPGGAMPDGAKSDGAMHHHIKGFSCHSFNCTLRGVAAPVALSS
jgi:hypothetical protein